MNAETRGQSSPAEPKPAADGPGSPSASDRPAYTIDELAALTSVPSRTIRFYQAKGALPPPIRRGRVAYYDDTHADRLRLVAHLQDRGLSLRAIRDLLLRTEGGEVSVSEWLGVGEQLRVPWTEDRPRVIDESELDQLLGGPPRPGLVAEFVRTGLLRREPGLSSTSYFMPSPALLQIALRLDAAGVDIGTAEAAHEMLRKHMSRAADELVEYFVRQARDASGPGEVSQSLEALRSVGSDVVRLTFAQEVERALREALEQGKALPPLRKRRR